VTCAKIKEGEFDKNGKLCYLYKVRTAGFCVGDHLIDLPPELLVRSGGFWFSLLVVFDPKLTATSRSQDKRYYQKPVRVGIELRG